MVVAPEEAGALGGEAEGAEPGAHAELPHHADGELGGTGEVVGGTAGDLPEDQALRGTPAHPDGERVGEVALRVQVTLVDREHLGDAEGMACREDGDLGYG